jgi:ribosome biogenesis GTPase
MNLLDDLGWTHYATLTGQLNTEPTTIARVSAEFGTRYEVMGSSGTTEAITPKTLRVKSLEHEWPKVGDWVRTETVPGDSKLKIAEVLPRFSKLTRKKPVGHDRGTETVQTLVTNIDTCAVVWSATVPLDIEKLRGFVEVASQAPRHLLLINKIDAINAEQLQKITFTLGQEFPNTEVVAMSAASGTRLAEAARIFAPHTTSVLLGPSGVGKSSIINALLGQAKLQVGDVRESDSTGRHTTTSRQLLILPDGGIIIDTPGLRQVTVNSNDPAADPQRSHSKLFKAKREKQNRKHAQQIDEE